MFHDRIVATGRGPFLAKSPARSLHDYEVGRVPTSRTR
jgi:hypothetical protein